MSWDSDKALEQSFLYYSADLLTEYSSEDINVTSAISRAIHDGDVEAVQMLIQSNRSLNINIPDDYGNVLLHKAAEGDPKECSLEILNILLDQADINLNYKNHNGSTPLFNSIKKIQSDSYIRRLLEAGCDVNIINDVGVSPLHLAVALASHTITHELIMRGADINAKTADGSTPLHYAVAENNFEATCMLLCNSVDVTVTSYDCTPFMDAVENMNKLNIARVLFDYYDDFSCTTEGGTTALLLAAEQLSPITIDIVKAGADVNCINDDRCPLLLSALRFSTADLFKLIWPKSDKNILLDVEVSILWILTQRCSFPVSDWVDCLYLILDSKIIFDLIERANARTIFWIYRWEYVMDRCIRKSFFFVLIENLFNRGVGLSDRLAIIYQYLSLGVEVDISDINLLNELYGFNEELEIFIQFSSHIEILNGCAEDNFPLTTFIFAQEQNYNSPERIAELFKNQIRNCINTGVSSRAENDILNALSFFSFPYTVKEKIMLVVNNKPAIVDKLRRIPEFPRLTELCRNQIRKSIQQNPRIRNPCQFHKAVQNLRLPPILKDVIRFKEPLY